MWLLEPELNDTVHHGWIKSLSDNIISKINSFSEEMNTWGYKLRRKYDDQIQSIRQELEATRQSNDMNNSDKSPDLDGLNPTFYNKKNWYLCGTNPNITW